MGPGKESRLETQEGEAEPESRSTVKTRGAHRNQGSQMARQIEWGRLQTPEIRA